MGKGKRIRCPKCFGDLSERDSTVLSDNPTGPPRVLCARCGNDLSDVMEDDLYDD